MKTIFIFKNGAVKCDELNNFQPIYYEVVTKNLGAFFTYDEEMPPLDTRLDQRMFVGRKISGHSSEEIIIYVEK